MSNFTLSRCSKTGKARVGFHAETNRSAVLYRTGPGHNEPRLTADKRIGGLGIVQISCQEVIKADIFSRGGFAGQERPLSVLVPTAHPRNRYRGQPSSCPAARRRPIQTFVG